jgi:polysaccharide biosynthesis protein PslL
MAETNQRMAWIDVLKGIAILFVVLGHNPLTTAHPKIFNIIFSFHIPLFFFISGYLFKPDQSIGKHIRKRFNSLLKPYLFTVLLISLAYLLVKSDTSLWWYPIWTIYGNGPNLPKAVLHLWFLPHLFLVTLIVWTLFKYIIILKNSIIARPIIVAILLVSGILGLHLFWNATIPEFVSNLFSTDINSFLMNGLLANPAYLETQSLDEKQFILKGLPWSIDIALISSAFFISGYFVKKYIQDKFFHKDSIAMLMLLLFAALHFFYNYTIDLNMRRYDSFLICTLLAYSGIYVCMYSAYIIASRNNGLTKALQYIGGYTLVIFIFHPMIQSKVYFAILSFVHQDSIAFLPAFAVGIGVPLLLNWLLLERFKFFRYWYYAK